MTFKRPGNLAVRSVNQYRRRDVLTYLSLRYYLENSAARSDSWTQRIACNLVLNRDAIPYMHVHHFKDVGSDGHIHRAFHLPGANEALAEAALLDECSKHKNVFGNHSSVFSYALASRGDRRGVFQPYYEGLIKRHKAISRAAKNYPSGIVQYIDIKKFYPSITEQCAKDVWDKSCIKAGLEPRWVALGHKLITDHVSVQRINEHGLLTGPMFSHLIANLVLRDIDIILSQKLPDRYFRYVDDITLVGDQAEVDMLSKFIEEELVKVNLKVHPEGHDKRYSVSTSEWLESEHDWDPSLVGKKWPALIGKIKRYLFLHGEDQALLREIFYRNEFRLPILDYTTAVAELDWVTRFKALVAQYWFRARLGGIHPMRILGDAIDLRQQRVFDFEELFRQVETATGFHRKRLISKLRYCAGQLIYLASSAELLELGRKALNIQELYLLGRVMEAVATRNVDALIPLGSNAAQAAAQALATSNEPVALTLRSFNDVELQSLAILGFNGIGFKWDSISPISDLTRFAVYGSDRGLMRSEDAFIKQMACLHGLGIARHSEMLRTAFDYDEDLVADAMVESASPSP